MQHPHKASQWSQSTWTHTHTLVLCLQLSVGLLLKPPTSTEKVNLHVVILDGLAGIKIK